MPLQDYLLPLENIKFYSKSSVTYGDKRYNVLVTDKRLILFAQRGHILRSDDIVSERLDRLQGVEYSEKGLLFKTAKISVQGASKMEMRGSPSEIKPLFQSIQSVINIEWNVFGSIFNATSEDVWRESRQKVIWGYSGTLCGTMEQYFYRIIIR